MENGDVFNIPVRKDGFIYATGLCKIIKKHIGNWLKLKKTKEVQLKLESQIQNKVIEIYKGGNDKNIQGTWLHPQIVINFLRWCSPSFSLQFSQLKEYELEDNVELNNVELNNIELDIKKYLEEQILINKELINELNIKKEEIQWLENKNKELVNEVTNKKLEIQFLENKFIRLQKREKCEDNNVIYLITNEDIKKERVYIIGKAVDMKTRLTTYNKSLEHEIIYNKSFKNMYQMKVAEMMVLYKLNKYLDKPKKERLILPKNEDISIFTKIIDNVYEWFKNINNIIVDTNFVNKEEIKLPKQPIKKGSFEKNTVYMLSSKIHLEKRAFIIGKSTNLNYRLNAYNKGLDHDVVYYKKCKNKYHMDIIELMILYKLDNFRERANRDRFILPNDKNIDLFTNIFDEAIKWFEDIDEKFILIKDEEFKKQDNKESRKNYRELNRDKLIFIGKNYRENNKEELLKKAKNYREENKEKVSYGKKKWYFKNKEKVIDRIKENYYKNKEQKIEKVKEYYNKNKEKVKERESIKITCECGSIFRKYGLQKHVKTEKHLKFIENNSKKSNDIL